MRHLRYMLIAIACVGMSLDVVFAQDDALEGGTVRGLITDLTPAQNPMRALKSRLLPKTAKRHGQQKRMLTASTNTLGFPPGAT